MPKWEKLLHQFADFLQDLLLSVLVYGFLVLACLAAALVVYLVIRDFLAQRRPAGEDEFHPGPFSLRRGSHLREHFSRRHEVEVKTRWYSSGKWVPRE